MGPQKAPGEARALVSSCSALLPTPKITQAVARSIDQEPTAAHVISKAKGASPKLASACRGVAGRSCSPVQHLFSTGPESCLDPSALSPEAKSPWASPGQRPPLGAGLRLTGPSSHLPATSLLVSVICPLCPPSPGPLVPSRGSAIPLRACHSQPSTWPKQRPPSTPPALPSSDLPFGPLSRALPTSTQLCVTALAPVAHTRRWPRPE